MKKKFVFLGRLLAVLLALLMCAALVLLIVPLTEKGDRTPVPGSADWMAQLPDEKLLSEIVIPGTHDCATQYVQLGFITKCQALSVGEQLEAGFRYLDIRLGADPDFGPFRLMHGFTECKTAAVGGKALLIDDVLADCFRFLEEHPTETVLFAVKHEHGEVSAEAFENTMDAVVRAQGEKWLLTDHIPTLGEARGKLVLLRRYEDAVGLGERAGIPLLWEDQGGSGDPSRNVSAEDNGRYTLWVQDRFCYDTEDKWNAFTEGMNTAREREAGDAALHFLSTKGTASYGHPYAFAKELNSRLMEANLALDGWVVVDFASAPLAERIYSCN